MRTYDEAFAAAKDQSPFSNGTEGHAWMANWCESCTNDSPELVDRGEGCPLIMVALMGRTPAEWIDQTADGHYLGDTYHCTEFRERPEDDDEDAPPPPPSYDAEMPGQTTIFEVMADQAVEQFEREPLPTPAGAQ
jgi:hypothetical protein